MTKKLRAGLRAIVATAIVVVCLTGCGKRVPVEEAPGSLVGTVTDSRTGKPVQANVSIAGTATGDTCDLQGNYRIARLAPGTYDLSVSGVMYITSKVTDVVIRSGETTRIDVKLEMKPGEPMATPRVTSEEWPMPERDLVRIVCRLGAVLVVLGALTACYFERPVHPDANPDRIPPKLLGNIAGQVVNKSNGKPVEGAYVFVYGSEKNALTDEDGRFEIDSLPASPYTIKISHVLHFAYWRDDVQVKPNKTTTVKIRLEAKPIELTYGFIKGRVLDSLTGEPVANANLLLVGTRLGAQTDSAGCFEISDVPAATYTIRVSQLRHLTREYHEVLVEPRTVSELHVSLEPFIGPRNIEDIILYCPGAPLRRQKD